MGDKKRLEDLLRNCVLFHDLTQEDIRKVAMYFEIVELPAGSILFYEKEKRSDMYVVLEGSVKASLFDEHGNELILAEVGPGEFIGEMSMIDELPRSATAIVNERAKLGILSRSAFMKVVKENPGIAVNVIKALVSRLRRTDDMVEALAFRNVEGRIVKFLINRGKERGTQEGDKIKVRKMVHRDLAARIGASREAVTKALKALVFKGVIEDRGNFWLVSQEAEKGIDP